jgi:hypothetical protein
MNPCHCSFSGVTGLVVAFSRNCGFFPTTNCRIVTLDKEGGHLVSCALTHFLASYSGQITNDIWDTYAARSVLLRLQVAHITIFPNRDKRLACIAPHDGGSAMPKEIASDGCSNFGELGNDVQIMLRNRMTNCRTWDGS